MLGRRVAGGWGVCGRRAGCHVELGAPARPGRPGTRPGSRPRHSSADGRPLRYARRRANRCARRGTQLGPNEPAPRRVPRRRRSVALSHGLHGGGRRAGGGEAGGSAQVRPARGLGLC
ncbi:unnamed protein product [Leptosia nina]|uniref:Uncharacterized protein n=1 Tax=Leptosia nina TaxID=320188 RepID=A0AAV1K5G8_9NEOP